MYLSISDLKQCYVFQTGHIQVVGTVGPLAPDHMQARNPHVRSRMLHLCRLLRNEDLPRLIA
jgi:hypothetical protein